MKTIVYLLLICLVYTQNIGAQTIRTNAKATAKAKQKAKNPKKTVKSVKMLADTAAIPACMQRSEVIALIQSMQADILKDSDGDGVPDLLDRESNTPKDCPVDTRGEMLDSDGDGVKDCDDKEPYSLPGFPVDPNGVVTRPLHNMDCSVCCGFCPRPDVFMVSPFLFTKKQFIVTAETQSSLKNIGRILEKNNTICLALEGYTDDGITDAKANAVLSYKRAKAVADYLSRNYGVASDRLKIKIKGEENVIKEGISKESRRFNRRVEVYIVPCTEVSDDEPKM